MGGHSLTLSLPPVLCDPTVQKAHYDLVEKEVEKGVKESATREKAYPPRSDSIKVDTADVAGGVGREKQ